VRRLAAACVLALALAPSAAAHPGHGPTTIDTSGFAFKPADVIVGQNDTVVWFFSSSIDRNHSVTSDPGQADSWDSDPGVASPPQKKPNSFYSRVFRTLGKFTYYCKNHANMRGTVEVRPVTGQIDNVPPTLSRARIRKRTLGFDLSEKADVVVRIQRRQRGRWRTKRTLDFRGRSGRNRRKLSYRRLAGGRYRVLLRAYDAGGLSSGAVTVRFRVKRPG